MKALFHAKRSEIEVKKSLGYDLTTFVQNCQIGVWLCSTEFDFEWTYDNVVCKNLSFFNYYRTIFFQFFQFKFFEAGVMSFSDR